MPHRNKIFDSDAHFEVNALTRQIENKTPSKITLMQNDHNSERFTFTVPRYIEGHDMLEVSKAEVHYLNGETAGIYEMKDVAIDAKDESKVICSWLLSSNATQNAGSLKFLLKFICFSEDGTTVDYAWHTAPFNSISISAGINNTETVAEKNVDILEQWKQNFVQKKEKNAAGGVAGLDENGKLLASVIPEGSGGSGVTVDSELSLTSTNPVQNKVVAEALEDAEPFVVTATLAELHESSTPGQSYYDVTFDKTISEIEEAYDAGKIIMLMLYADNGDSVRISTSFNKFITQWFDSDGNPISEKETQVEWSVASTPGRTDFKLMYSPSLSIMYESELLITEYHLDTAIGDIETALNDIITDYGLGGDSQ